MGKEEIELITQFPRVMHMIKRKLMAGFVCSKPDLDPNPTQRMVLFLISDNKRLSMTELHKLTGFEKGSLTTVVDQLIQKGLVSRVGDEKDRRMVYVSLTVLGKKHVVILRKDIANFMQLRLEKLSNNQRAQFYTAAKILIDISLKL